jgi:hypothetical protein
MTNTLQSRLKALPPKIAVPFQQLLSTGQLSEDVVRTVLDAGELATNLGKLLGFAIGYLHLRQQGVPVHDVIAMAKKERRRINLAWSPSRWKDEHDRLSRVEALKRLSEEQTCYDLCAFRQLLPARFPGYLIATSRRLGMEGLRQRHCVASYDQRIKEGGCAIAAIFIDKRRWTVELHLTGDSKTPLRITQIKTRLNAHSPASVRQQIHDALGIPLQIATPPEPAPFDGDRLYMENLRRILPMLRQQDIRTIEVYFEGSGDSGCIQDIAFSPETPGIRQMTAEHLHTSSSFDNGVWRRAVEPQQAALGEVVEAITYDYLEETGVDWYNNDGGYGYFIIDVEAGTVSMDVSVRVTESYTEFSGVKDIATGEPV